MTPHTSSTLPTTLGGGGDSLPLFEEVEGQLDGNDETGERGGYIDWYDLDVVGGERVRVDLYSYDFDTYLVVELPDGTYLENDDGDGSDSSLSFTSEFDGTARVGATSFGHGEIGSYNLWVSTVEEHYIRVGDYITDALESGEISYSLEGYPGDRIVIELSSGDFDTYLTVEDSSGNYASNDDYGEFTDSRLVFQLGDSGDATITVSSWDSYGGDFELSVDLYMSDVEQLPEGYRLRDGDSIVGELGPGMPIYDGAYYQLFTFAANRGERVEILLESDDVDSFLRVVAPDGTEMTDDDGGGGYNSKLVYTTDRGGIFEVYATSLGYEEIGLYTISFTKLGEGQMILNIRGDLTRTDQQDITGKRYDIYSFQATSGSLVIIDVISAEFDTYAILRSSTGDVLLTDDDGGSDSNSRIQYTPDRSGNLELVVTSYAEGATGSYSVSIYE